jgi:hypothetical protein
MLRQDRRLQARLPDQLAAMCTLLLLVASVSAINLTMNGNGMPPDGVPSIATTADAVVADAPLPGLQAAQGQDLRFSLMIFRHQ